MIEKFKTSLEYSWEKIKPHWAAFLALALAVSIVGTGLYISTGC